MKRCFNVLIILLFFLPLTPVAKSAEKRTFRISKNLNLYNSVFRELDMFYVDTLNYDLLVKNSIDNMLSKLDPYTVYIPEEETDDLRFMTTGEYAGIGAVISKIGNNICIAEPYEGLPAQQNDLRAGDVLLEVDGKKVDKLSVSDASKLLKGLPNSKIQIKIKRHGDNKVLIKEFLRQKIQVNPVKYSTIVSDSIAYILLEEFTENAAMEIKNAVNDLKSKANIKALILDLRNNGGGLIDEAVKIMSYFVPKGTEVVATKGKNEDATRVYKTPTEPIFSDMKLVVITNRSSASASEILAGSVQDLDRGVIIGQRTFGKGLVQNIRPINYGGHLKVTTAKYYIPSGRCIQAIDYSSRKEDGSVGNIPDSLTKIFTTRNGRKVRDGGGIVPDSVTVSNRKLNISYYIYAQNLYFEYASLFVQTHPKIDLPEVFSLSDIDYDNFKKFLFEKKFTYVPQTQRYLNELIEFAKDENFDQSAKDELDALILKLTPDVSKLVDEYRADIAELLSLEIVKRYYFQKGEIRFALKGDKDFKLAVQILQTPSYYNKFLLVK